MMFLSLSPLNQPVCTCSGLTTMADVKEDVNGYYSEWETPSKTVHFAQLSESDAVIVIVVLYYLRMLYINTGLIVQYIYAVCSKKVTPK